MQDYKQIFKFSLPLMLSNLVTYFFSLSDLFWAGYLGTYATASMSFSIPIIVFINSLLFSIAKFTNISSSKYFGAKKLNKIKDLLSKSLGFSLCLSILVSFIILLFLNPLLGFLHCPNKIFSDVFIYTSVLLVAEPFIVFYIVLRSVIIAIKESKIIFYTTIISNIINFVMNYVLAVYFGFGVPGLAISTAISRAFLFVVFYYFLINKIGEFSLFRFDLNFAKKVISFVSIYFCENALRPISAFVFTRMAASFGPASLASLIITSRITTLVSHLSKGYSNAATSLFGNKLGKGLNKGHVFQRKIIFLGFFIFALFSIFIFLFSKQFVILFSRDKEVISLASFYISFLSISLAFYSVRIIILDLIKMHNKINISFIYQSISVITMVILSIVFTKYFNSIFGIWLAMFVVNILFSVIGFILYELFRKSI